MPSWVSFVFTGARSLDEAQVWVYLRWGVVAIKGKSASGLMSRQLVRLKYARFFCWLRHIAIRCSAWHSCCCIVDLELTGFRHEM